MAPTSIYCTSCRRCFGKTGVWHAARVPDNLRVVTTPKRSVKIRNCQATASVANHTQPQLKASAFFPFSVAVILIVQERVAGDPLWLQIGQAFHAWATPLLITIGGLWAFYRFRLRRESRRLKVEVAGRMERASGHGRPDLPRCHYYRHEHRRRGG